MTLLDLEKTLGMLCMPAGILWMLLLGCIYLLMRRRQWVPAALAAGIWILFTVAGNFYVGASLLAGLERTIPPVDLQGVQPFDAVFVLGGGTEIDPAGEPMLGSAGDRVITAARLWHAGKARCLVASGVSRDFTGALRDGGLETRAIWLSLGIPDRAILVVEEPCWVTRDEIKAYAHILERHDWARLALVSSGSHLPRAMALARRAGLDFTPVGSDWRGRAHRFQVQRMIPQGEGLDMTQRACWEYLGRWMGR